MTLTIKRFAAAVLRQHLGFLLPVLASSAALLILDATGTPGVAMPLLDLPSAFVLLILIPYGVGTAIAWHRLRHGEPWRAAWNAVRHGLARPDRLLGFAIVLVGGRAVLLNAVAWKASIPALHPFAYDAAFMRADRWLHVGVDPWRLLPTHPLVLRGLDAFYTLWFVAFCAVVIWWAVQPDSPARRRFLTTLAWTWLVGSVAAVLWPSAGPVYYAAVTGSQHYAPLLAAHAGLALTASDLQAALWDTYATGGGSVVKGIAAFPSLHVAMPALYAVSAPSQRWAALWWGFTLLTLAGSVALGWHYAVDGYAAILGVLLVWWLTGVLAPSPVTADGDLPHSRSQCRRGGCVASPQRSGLK